MARAHQKWNENSKRKIARRHAREDGQSDKLLREKGRIRRKNALESAHKDRKGNDESGYGFGNLRDRSLIGKQMAVDDADEQQATCDHDRSEFHPKVEPFFWSESLFERSL